MPFIMVFCRVLLLASFAVLVRCQPLVLTEENFQDTIGSGKPVFVKFYAPWCGHCKALAPTWDKLANQFALTNAIIAKVDCTVDTKLCADHGVKGYPTLKLFQDKSVWDHRGARDIDTLMDFITSNVGQVQEESNVGNVGLTELTDGSFESYITTTPGIHFIKFYAPWCGHCKRLAPVWDDLAKHFTDDPNVHISKVDCTKETLTCQIQEIKGYPTLLLFVNGLMVDKYGGSRDLGSLIQFVSDVAVREAPPVIGVEVLTNDNFASTLENSEHVFVKFFAPWCGHCKHLAPTWDKLAEAVHRSTSTVTIAKVDCTVDRELCSEQQIHGYPTLVLFSGGERKEYRGARDFDSLLRFLQENS